MIIKKLISLIFIFLLAINLNTAFAGDTTGVFMDGESAVFFGKVLSYDKATKNVAVIPTQKIKGDVEIGCEQTYEVY